MKVQDYVLIERNDINNLIKEVNGMIAVGWQPIGGIAVHQTVTQTLLDSIQSTNYVQALVKE